MGQGWQAEDSALAAGLVWFWGSHCLWLFPVSYVGFMKLLSNPRLVAKTCETHKNILPRWDSRCLALIHLCRKHVRWSYMLSCAINLEGTLIYSLGFRVHLHMVDPYM